MRYGNFGHTMSKSAASAKKVVVLNLRPCTVGLRSVGVGAVMLMAGCMTVVRRNRLGQLIQGSCNGGQEAAVYLERDRQPLSLG